MKPQYQLPYPPTTVIDPIALQIAARDAERRHLAAELHDNLGQRLSAIKFSVEAIQRLQQRDRESAAVTAPLLTMVVTRCREAIAELRRLTAGLHPPQLEQQGVVAAIATLLAQLQCHYPTIRLRSRLTLDEPTLSLPQRLDLYRLTQEALHNALQHANARTIEVVLWQQASWLRLMIRDDGEGFQRQQVIGGQGLATMQLRAERAGGELQIDAAPGHGCRVELRLPLPTATADAEN